MTWLAATLYLAAALDPLQDVHWLPDRQTLQALKSFNKDYRDHVEILMLIDTGNSCYWREVHRDAKRRWVILDLADDARNDNASPCYRRWAILELREMIGDDAFFNRRLPDPVPLWAFCEVTP